MSGDISLNSPNRNISKTVYKIGSKKYAVDKRTGTPL